MSQGGNTADLENHEFVKTIDGKLTPFVTGMFYRIKTVSTGAVLDDRGGKVGDGHKIITNVGLQDDVYNDLAQVLYWMIVVVKLVMVITLPRTLDCKMMFITIMISTELGTLYLLS
eukprot:TRINITY_DN936_c0_g1_i2.p1 TRINITY_DN936_c0_g1~~TRINITY_DN936_c0_g1_i2.p1  ORF type:complete len:116 (-),score=14.63 TRINITY_DN936_c0_g1_i2:53-400(-)